MKRLQMRIRHVARGDDGVSLLLALIFVATVGIVVSALLPYAQAGITETATARDVRMLQNAADGAIQGAIGQARNNPDDGSSLTGTCTPYNAPAYPNPGPVGGPQAVTVTCQGAGSLVNGSDVPPYAIVTTGGQTPWSSAVGGDGHVNISQNGVLTIDGGVYASGDITKGAGTPVVPVIGDVYTTPRHTCMSAITATGVKACPTTAPAFPDVNYPSATMPNPSTGPLDPQGTCASATSVVVFQPGYYTRSPQPGSSCAGNNSDVWWFASCASPPCGGTQLTAPGVYYFDFPDSSYGANVTSDYLWNLDNQKIQLIAGELRSPWDTPSVAYSVLDKPALAQPGQRCNPRGQGVQFILGGPTEIATGNNSSIEMCASQTSATSRQRIAIYGLTNGTARHTTLSPQTDPTLATDINGDTPFTNSSDALSTNGTAAYADFASTAATYGVRLSNFPGLTDGGLDGAVIADAVLKVTHAESTNKPNIMLTVKYSDGSSDVCTTSNSPLKVTNGTTLTTDTIDLFSQTSGCSGTLRNSRYPYQLLNGARVRWEVSETNAQSDTAHVQLDGVSLQVTDAAPASEAMRCPAGVSAPCYAYSNASSTANDNTYFLGTVYTPTAPINAVVHNLPNTVFQRGVIASSLDVTINSSSKQSSAPFELPHGSSPDRIVIFTATADKVRLVAKVHFIDCVPVATCVSQPDSDSDQISPGRAVEVMEWTVRR